MYGDKQQKQTRLQTLLAEVAKANGITQAGLARILGVPRSTINKDLAVLHEHGALLTEDDHGQLGLLTDD